MSGEVPGYWSNRWGGSWSEKLATPEKRSMAGGAQKGPSDKRARFAVDASASSWSASPSARSSVRPSRRPFVRQSVSSSGSDVEQPTDEVLPSIDETISEAPRSSSLSTGVAQPGLGAVRQLTDSSAEQPAVGAVEQPAHGSHVALMLKMLKNTPEHEQMLKVLDNMFRWGMSPSEVTHDKLIAQPAMALEDVFQRTEDLLEVVYDARVNTTELMRSQGNLAKTDIGTLLKDEFDAAWPAMKHLWTDNNAHVGRAMLRHGFQSLGDVKTVLQAIDAAKYLLKFPEAAWDNPL